MTKFVIDEGHNRHEAYSKEETDAAIDAQSSNLSNLAAAFSESATYAVGDWCIYDSVLYQCKQAITTAGAWRPSYWQAMTVTAGMNEVNSAISNVGFTTFTNGAYKRLTNGAVLLYLNGATHQQALSIPSPDRNYYYIGLNQDNNACGFFINTSGRLSIVNSSTNTAVYATVVYST